MGVAPVDALPRRLGHQHRVRLADDGAVRGTQVDPMRAGFVDGEFHDFDGAAAFGGRHHLAIHQHVERRHGAGRAVEPRILRPHR